MSAQRLAYAQDMRPLHSLWIVVDLDGTLCDCSHRVHWAQERLWDAFFEGILEDKPREDVVSFVRHIAPRCRVIVCTGRPERYLNQTEEWLIRHDLDECVDHILMRPDGDYSPDHELKPVMLEEFFGDKEATLRDVWFVLEDRDKVVEAMRNYGLNVWQVQAGAY